MAIMRRVANQPEPTKFAEDVARIAPATPAA
jgi:hypothetical protein